MKQTVPIASEYMPLPFKDGTKIKEDSEATLHTRLTAAQAAYIIRRDLPPPNVLEAFQDILERMQSQTEDPTQRGRPILLVGEAGCGKTSAVGLAARLCDNMEPLSFDCGNRSLDELLVEPYFNEATEALCKIIQERFNKETMPHLHPLSVQLLKETFSRKDPKNPERDAFPGVLVKDDQDREVLDLSKLGGKMAIETALNVIEQVAKNEQIGGGTKLGIAFKEGKFIIAAREGRPLLIDEADKALENTGTSMQQVWTAISGLGSPYPFEHQGVSFYFSPKDIHPNFTPILTANHAGDGGEIAGLRDSTRDRLHIINVDVSDAESIAIRIGQKLLGFNFLTLESCEGEEKDVAELFMRLAELNNVVFDEETKLLIKNWKKTVQACRQLGKFYYQFNDIIKPNNPSVNDPLLEQTRNIGLQLQGVRAAQDNIRLAKDYKPRKALDPNSKKAITKGFDVLADLLERKPAAKIESVKLGLGERLEAVIMKRLREVACGPDTRKMIVEAAKMNGVFPEVDEESNKNPDLTLVRDLLNTESKELEIAAGTEELRDKLVEILRQRHPELAKVESDKIISIAHLQLNINSTVEKAKESEEVDTSYIVGLNPDYALGKGEDPLTIVTVLDTATKEHKERILANYKDYLVSADEVCEVIGHPGIRDSLIKSLWTDDLREMVKKCSAGEASKEDFGSFTGDARDLRIAKLIARGKNGITTILVFDSIAKGKTILYNPALKTSSDPTNPTSIVTNPKELMEKLTKDWGVPEQTIKDGLNFIKDPVHLRCEQEGEVVIAKTNGKPLSIEENSSVRPGQVIASVGGVEITSPVEGTLQSLTDKTTLKAGDAVASIAIDMDAVETILERVTSESKNFRKSKIPLVLKNEKGTKPPFRRKGGRRKNAADVEKTAEMA